MRLPHQPNPYRARTSIVQPPLAGLYGYLGDDDPAPIDIPTDIPTPDGGASIDPAEGFALGPSGIPSAVPDMSAAAPGASVDQLFAQAQSATAAQTAAPATTGWAGTGDGMPATSAPAPSAQAQSTTVTPNAPAAAPAPAAASGGSSSNSMDWSKAIATALAAGGAATTAVITGRTNKDIAAMNAQAQQGGGAANGALSRAAGNLTNAFKGALSKVPSWLPWAIGGGTIVLIGLVMLKRHSSKNSSTPPTK